MALAFPRESASLEEDMGLETTLQKRYNALVCGFIADPFQRQHDIHAHARITALYSSIKAECLSLPQYMEVAKYYGLAHTINRLGHIDSITNKRQCWQLLVLFNIICAYTKN